MIAWQILEHRDIEKKWSKLPKEICRKYELWRDVILKHGPEALKRFPGFHDEKLKGARRGQRSSRLNQQYRVIYAVERETVLVLVLEISPHHY